MYAKTFTNEAIEVGSLPKYEEIALNKPHNDYWKIISINLFIFLVTLGIILSILFYLIKAISPNLILPVASSYCILAVLLFFIYRISFKKRGYAIRTKDVIYKSGIIAESTTILPLNRIQHIELNEGMFSRIYQLASLQIFTAGGQSGHIRISGIPVNEAKSIRDLLLNELNLMENPTKNSE